MLPCNRYNIPQDIEIIIDNQNKRHAAYQGTPLCYRPPTGQIEGEPGDQCHTTKHKMVF